MPTLDAYRSQLDASVAHYCDGLLAQTEERFGPYSREAAETYCSLLSRGGKRLRGALTMASYFMVGGKDEKLAVEAGRIVEMLNTSLLIFDDIADLSTKRRGGPTVHTMFADYHRAAKLFGDSDHFGVAMGLHVGLLGNYLVAAELARLRAPDAVKVAATKNLNQAILTTVHGQFNDIANEAVRLVSEPQVLRTLTWKAAYYTLLQPIQFGMILAGRSDDTHVPAVRDYAMNLGLAFQIIDDILGTFGEEEKSGKSNTEDLQEGKITLLVSRALQRGTAEQKKALLAVLGNRKLTIADYEVCKQIMRDTGALAYTRDVAGQYARAATRALNAAPEHWSAEGKDFLRDLAAFVVARNV